MRLQDGAFQKLFGMDKATWATQPDFVKIREKKRRQLF